MKFFLEHMLPRKLRYARVYLEAGGASVFFSLNGANADWHASIGSSREVEMSDLEYTRRRANLPAVEKVDDDGRTVIVRNAQGYEEQWKKPQWVLMNLRKTRGSGQDR
ncbi:MAG: hypothetical protein LYZ69_08935 [Nitrososphaerales archaeon]|nr:hypothetical protein [Nitrososphaerales archaeon]